MHLFQPTLPVRAEVDIKLGGTQCNLLMSRLERWLRIKFSRDKKKMVLQEGKTKSKKSSLSEVKAIMWTCTVSAPEMTLLLYSVSGSPLYHVSFLCRPLLDLAYFCCILHYLLVGTG